MSKRLKPHARPRMRSLVIRHTDPTTIPRHTLILRPRELGPAQESYGAIPETNTLRTDAMVPRISSKIDPYFHG